MSVLIAVNRHVFNGVPTTTARGAADERGGGACLVGV